jgi:hypothetical protein
MSRDIEKAIQKNGSPVGPPKGDDEVFCRFHEQRV